MRACVRVCWPESPSWFLYILLLVCVCVCVCVCVFVYVCVCVYVWYVDVFCNVIILLWECCVNRVHASCHGNCLVIAPVGRQCSSDISNKMYTCVCVCVGGGYGKNQNQLPLCRDVVPPPPHLISFPPDLASRVRNEIIDFFLMKYCQSCQVCFLCDTSFSLLA